MINKKKKESNEKEVLTTDVKVESCKLNNNKYMMSSTHITNTELLEAETFKAVLYFKLLSCKFLFIIRKDKRNCAKVGYFFENSKFHE